MALATVAQFGCRSDVLQLMQFVVESVMIKTETVLQGLLKHARSEILKEFRADSCIASTAVALDVLTKYGVFAEPFPIRSLIFNKPYASRMVDSFGWPNAEEVQRWAQEDGSYSIGVGVGTSLPNKWAGHLTALVERRFLLDLSIDQASRPQYNIVLNPFSIEVDEKFLSGEPKVFALNECVIRLDVLRGEENNEYTSSPDWIFAGRRSKIVDRIICLIQGEL